MAKFDYNFFTYFSDLERRIKAQPLNLGAIIGSGGGNGGPPGGFVGMLPQTRVAYDTTEAEDDGFVSPNPYDPSGILVSATLLDNLNHIRYRIATLEGGGPGVANLDVYENDVVVKTGVTILDFQGASWTITDTGPGEVEIEIDTATNFLALTDTPSSYAGQANKLVSVNGSANALEFITVASGGVSDSFKVKVSSDDTTEDFLESKIVAGNGISVTVLDDGANEQLEISATISSNIHVIGFFSQGTLSVGQKAPRVKSPWAGEIFEVISSVGLNGQPTGSGIISDIEKGGTTIFTNQANRPTILDGELDSASTIPDVTTVSVDDVFTFSIDQVGTTTSGSNLMVQVRMLAT
jgi:hypothetical protein